EPCASAYSATRALLAMNAAQAVLIAACRLARAGAALVTGERVLPHLLRTSSPPRRCGWCRSSARWTTITTPSRGGENWRPACLTTHPRDSAYDSGSTRAATDRWAAALTVTRPGEGGALWESSTASRRASSGW